MAPIKGNPPSSKLPPKRNAKQPNGNMWIIIACLLIMLVLSLRSPDMHTANQRQITYSEFYDKVKDNAQTQEIKEVELTEGPENILKGKYSNGLEFRLNIPQRDEELIKLIRDNVSKFTVVPPELFWSQLFFQLIPFIAIFLLFYFISMRGSQMGSKIFAFGKSKAQVGNGGAITFKDVAGVDEAKEELQEVIEFLKEPKRFEKLGGKIPKGVLLVGPPGTGKTLLAKAVAGEAGVPFYSLSGSDFVEMFVGVGASRVRDLFEQGRKASKTSGRGCIIFIDEIDAVGRQRFAGVGGGNDEREQTLNALLVEMDGFNTVPGLILIAATNRPDTLDPALLRPGRFDRQVTVGLPDINGREGILKVHTKNIKLAPDVNIRRIAQQTVYFSGADLANVCNEAALLAARKGKEEVGLDDMLAAVERVTMGPEKKSRTVSKKEKEMTAYHEAGHALLSVLIDEVDPFSKVSIIPRGMAGGYTLTPPKEDKHYMSKKELKGMMVVLLGGMVGEEIYMNDTTTGVSNDLQRVTQIARSMVCEYGMSDNLDKLAFGHRSHPMFLGRDLFDEQRNYSEETARKIDAEIHQIVKSCYDRAKELLITNKEKLDALASRLIEKETLDIEEVKVLLSIPDHKLNFLRDN